MLYEGEALLVFLDTDERLKPLPEETFIWAITKTDSRWVRSGLGTKALQKRVAALRCGLDEALWVGEGHVHCATLIGLDPKASRPSAPLARFRVIHFATHGLLAGETACSTLLLSLVEEALERLHGPVSFFFGEERADRHEQGPDDRH